jgi:UDP:flavonoid glycosyltransferase YjiC (YdhE family)
VAHHGAGLRLKPKSSSATIARAVRRVLEEPSFGVGADRLGAAIAEETTRDLAAEELELLALKEATVLPKAAYRSPIQDSAASSVSS